MKSRMTVATTRNDDAVERVIEAAGRCVERLGFDNVSVDDIVREAGVPKTTVYRKIGNKNAVLRTLLMRDVHELAEKTAALAAGPGEASARLERVFITTAIRLANHPWLGPALRHGLSASAKALFDEVRNEFAESDLDKLLQATHEEGRLRSNLNVEDSRVWLRQQLLNIGMSGIRNEDDIRSYVNLFVLPVLIPDIYRLAPSLEAHPDNVTTDLASLDEMLKTIQSLTAALGAIRRRTLDARVIG